ncbi:peptidase [Xanthomonas albilineans]|nr:peptidase [Xanthomonas albilineans]
MIVNPMRMLLLSAALFMGGAAQAANDASVGEGGSEIDAAVPSAYDSDECGGSVPLG